MDFQNFQSADVLSNSGSLFVQKSQQGGGSPSIRGFEASRVLLPWMVFV
jgi:hemoglobin/transferrin/lactoferrin receptor protein